METPPNTSSAPLKWQGFVFAALICATALAAYWSSFDAAFVMDDHGNIEQNEHIRSLTPLWKAMHAPMGLGIAGRPLINFTLAINYAISGYQVWSYHAMNLLFHVISALTLMGIIRRTLLNPRFQGKYQNAAPWLAGVCALIWVAHPLNTQAVTYVIQRCESLMAMFFLLTLYAAIRGFEHGGGRGKAFWHGGAVLLCALGALSKEVTLAAPFAVLLYDRTFFAPRMSAALRRSWPLYAGYLLVLLGLGALVGYVGMHSSGREELHHGSLEYARTQGEVILHYLRLSLWPSPLVLDYGWPIAPLSKVWPALLATIGLFLGSCVALWKRLPLAYPAVWFFLILAPSSSFVPIQDIAFEHRMYLPLMGVVVFLVVGVYALARWLLERTSLPALGRPAAIAGGLGCLALVGVFSVMTYQRNFVYYDEFKTWEDSLAKRPDNFRARRILGVTLSEAGRQDEAIPLFLEGIRRNPDEPQGYFYLGTMYAEQNRLDEAIENFVKALNLDPTLVDAYVNLAISLTIQQRHQEAAMVAEQGLAQKPPRSKAQYLMRLRAENIAILMKQRQEQQQRGDTPPGTTTTPPAP